MIYMYTHEKLEELSEMLKTASIELLDLAQVQKKFGNSILLREEIVALREDLRSIIVKNKRENRIFTIITDLMFFLIKILISFIKK